MTDPIKTRADGSIDTAHYIRFGRIARSQVAHDMVRTAPPNRSSHMGTRRSWLLPIAILYVVALTLPYLA